MVKCCCQCKNAGAGKLRQPVLSNHSFRDLPKHHLNRCFSSAPLGLVPTSHHVITLYFASNFIRAWELFDVIFKLPLVPQELDVRSINGNSALLPQLNVLIPLQRGETPILTDNDLLSSRKFIH
jgi:hypothetical protein